MARGEAPTSREGMEQLRSEHAVSAVDAADAGTDGGAAAMEKYLWGNGAQLGGDRRDVRSGPRRSRSSSATAATRVRTRRFEPFFKALKQNLKIKTFVGTSPNALRVQIWTALIAILVLHFLQLRSRLAGRSPISWRCCA